MYACVYQMLDQLDHGVQLIFFVFKWIYLHKLQIFLLKNKFCFE